MYESKTESERLVGVTEHQMEMPIKAEQPVGRIDFLSRNGLIRESVDYTDATQFRQDIQKENYYGVPMSVVLYRDAEGKTIPTDFLYELDPPPSGFHIESAPNHPLTMKEQMAQAIGRSTTAPDKGRGPAQKAHEDLSLDK